MSAATDEELAVVDALLNARDLIQSAADDLRPYGSGEPTVTLDQIVAEAKSQATGGYTNAVNALDLVAEAMYNRGELDDATGKRTIWATPEAAIA